MNIYTISVLPLVRVNVYQLHQLDCIPHKVPGEVKRIEIDFIKNYQKRIPTVIPERNPAQGPVNLSITELSVIS